MKDNPLTLEVGVVEKKTLPGAMGVALNPTNVLPGVPAGASAESNLGSGGTGYFAFLRPMLSNLFLLGCLLGLFVLYCCSCVIHALTFAFRGKSS